MTDATDPTAGLDETAQQAEQEEQETELDAQESLGEPLDEFGDDQLLAQEEGEA